MKKIFISHRLCDSALINELVQYLENIGINKDKIMYTSADSCGIQYDLGAEIKEALFTAEKFIVILSPNYYESVFCCNELGYIWATGKTPIIFGLPGIDSDKDFNGFVNNGWFIRRLNNSRHIDFLYQELQCYSNKEFTSPVKPNEYKEIYLKKINEALEKYALSKSIKAKEKYAPEKLIDIDTLIQSNYYTDKELLFFKYLLDTNNYVWGLSENIQKDIIKWEKKNRFIPFLSENLENFFIMLFDKHYLSNKIITRQEAAIQSYAGKNNEFSKMVRAYFQADENGNTRHNYFSMDERLFREIVNIDEESKEVIDKVISKYKLKWYQRYPTKKGKH